MHAQSGGAAWLKGQYLVGKGSTNHALLMPSLMCPVVMLWILIFFFLLYAVSQGHVGIVLAHTLPDCQVTRVCCCRCVFVHVFNLLQAFVIIFDIVKTKRLIYKPIYQLIMRYDY